MRQACKAARTRALLNVPVRRRRSRRRGQRGSSKSKKPMQRTTPKMGGILFMGYLLYDSGDLAHMCWYCVYCSPKPLFYFFYSCILLDIPTKDFRGRGTPRHRYGHVGTCDLPSARKASCGVL